MRPFRFSAHRLLDAPAEVIYHCLRDYREHHRPGGFLPPAFTQLEVLSGGVGAGTVIRFTTRVGGQSATRTQTVSEPEPGRVLVEGDETEGSTFVVEPRGQQSLVRIDTVLDTRGVQGLLMHLVGARILRPLYADELERLERYAQAHGPLPPAGQTANDPELARAPGR